MVRWRWICNRCHWLVVTAVSVVHTTTLQMQIKWHQSQRGKKNNLVQSDYHTCKHSDEELVLHNSKYVLTNNYQHNMILLSIIVVILILCVHSQWGKARNADQFLFSRSLLWLRLTIQCWARNPGGGGTVIRELLSDYPLPFTPHDTLSLRMTNCMKKKSKKNMT